MNVNGSNNREPGNTNAGPVGSNGSKPVAPSAQPAAVHHYYYYEPKHARSERSSKPAIAGALLIITAIVGLIAGVLILGSGFYVDDFGDDYDFWAGGNEGDVYGRVTYMNGTGVDEVRVTIVGEGIQVETDDDGYYRIYDVPAGNTEIKLEKSGHNTYTRKVMVSPYDDNWDHDGNGMGGENHHDFVMTEGGSSIERGEYPDWNVIGGFFLVCSSLIIVFSIAALVGGVFAIKRKNYNFAVLGAVLGIFTLIGALFALVALIVLAISRDEFKRGGD